jgi:excisionase family DNA binding protein
LNVGKVIDAARVLKISRSMGYELAAAGKLPGTFRLEGTTIIRVDLDQLEAWVQAQGEANDAGTAVSS